MTQDLTEKFRSVEEQAPKLLLRVSGKLLNLHGQYDRRQQIVTKGIYDRADIEEAEKAGISDVTKVAAKRARTDVIEVHTFPKNEKGKIVAPLGGSRGYLMGALRAAVKTKYPASERTRRSSSVYGLGTKIDQGVFIEPDWIELGESFSNPPDKPRSYLIQRVGSTEYYDLVEEALFGVNIRVESDIAEDIILELLSFIQRLGLGPKRRGLMRIEKVEKL